MILLGYWPLKCIEFSQTKAEDGELFNSLVEDISASTVDVIDVVRLGDKS